MVADGLLLRRLVIVTVIGLGGCHVAHACSCDPDRHLMSALEAALDSDLVFVGEAMSSRPGDIQQGPFSSGPQFEFSVQELFAGDKDAETIWVGTPGGSCSFSFTIGETYLVYADRSGEPDLFFTGPCQGNRNVLDAESELLLLRENPIPEIPVTLRIGYGEGTLWIRYSGGTHRRWRLESSLDLKNWIVEGDEFYGLHGRDESRLLLSKTGLVARQQFFRVREITE